MLWSGSVAEVPWVWILVGVRLSGTASCRFSFVDVVLRSFEAKSCGVVRWESFLGDYLITGSILLPEEPCEIQIEAEMTAFSCVCGL